MKTAKDLFEELGYERTRIKNNIEYYNKETDDDIWFYGQSKVVNLFGEFDATMLKAINQQIEELGW